MENEIIYENEVENVSGEFGSEEIGKGLPEVRQDAEEVLETAENEIDTVSGGDSIVNYEEELTMILNEIIEQREDMETLQEYIEYRDLNIFEKELEDYTVTESILLLIFFCLLFGMLLKLIGGIIACKV